MIIPYDGVKLSEKEKQCLVFAAQDKSVLVTAENMHVAPDTVKKYRKKILRKLGCETIVGALVVAVKNNILQDDLFRMP